MRKVERYWKTRVELVSALKEDTTSCLMAVHEIESEKAEGVHVVNVEGTSPGEPMHFDDMKNIHIFLPSDANSTILDHPQGYDRSLIGHVDDER